MLASPAAVDEKYLIVEVAWFLHQVFSRKETHKLIVLELKSTSRFLCVNNVFCVSKKSSTNLFKDTVSLEAQKEEKVCVWAQLKKCPKIATGPFTLFENVSLALFAF